MNRRGFLSGMAGILAAGIAPAFIANAMPIVVRPLWTPSRTILRADLYRDGVFIDEIVGPIDYAGTQWATRTRWVDGDEFRRLYPGVRMATALQFNRLPPFVAVK